MYGGVPGPQSYGGVDDDAALEREVRRRVKKIEREEERQLRREARARGIENKREQEREAAGSAIYSLGVLSIIFTITILVPIFFKSWAVKAWIGFGVRYLWIYVGLLYMEVQVDCASHKLIEDRLCQVVDKVSGSYPVHTGVNMACSVSNRACEIMNMLYLASFLVFGTLLLSVVFQLLGAALLYNYWYNEPIPRIRRLGVFLVFASPMVGSFGLLAWSLLAPDIESLPSAWTSAGAVLSGTTFFGYKPLPYAYYGACFWVSASTYVLQGGCLVWLFFSSFQKHSLEEEVRENERREKERLETQVHTSAAGGFPYDLGHGCVANPAAIGAPGYATPGMASASASGGAPYGALPMSSGGYMAAPQPRNAPW